MRIRRVVLAALMLAGACRARPVPVPVPAIGETGIERFVARGREAMVASADERATAAGLRMLQRGGNAVDAFAAVSFAVGVVRPQSTGLGGGGFAVLHLSDPGKPPQRRAFDFRERAPAAAARDMYIAPGVPERASLFGPLSIATPGLVAGVLLVHERYGRLPRHEVMAPAITLAEEGFPVYAGLASTLAKMAPILARHPESARIFLPAGRPPREGEILRQPDLGRTLRDIADRGRDAFYSGTTAEAIAAEVGRLGGLLTTADLSAYRVIERAAIAGRYRGYDLVGMPPPSAGGILLVEMLNMLDAARRRAPPTTEAERVHLLAEVMRRAYEDRSQHLGDPDFVEIPVERLLSPEFAAERVADFDPSQATRRGQGIEGEIGITSTTHISILDGEGNAVAATETINFSFGSGITVPGTGILLNDEMDDFSSQPGVPDVYGLVGTEANAIAPFKTPLSSMSPTIVSRDGVPFLIAGSPGGSLIITSTLQTILNVIDRGMALPQAVAAPRIHHQALPNRINYEDGAFSEATARELERRGHALHRIESMGNVQAVMRLPSGEIVGVSDPRAEGRPAGY